MTAHAMVANASNVRRLAHLDIPGGGQIYVEGHLAFVGHMAGPQGTSIIDVSDASHPRVLATTTVGRGSHSHKVRVAGSLMAVNSERHQHGTDPVPLADYHDGGLQLFSIDDPAAPLLLGSFPVPGRGVHRFDLDAHYAYLSTTMDGYQGNIVLIVDISDPAHPVEVSRWWMPGQWIAGGEEPSWGTRKFECHHPLRFGDRLYVSYCQGGVLILDISDIRHPRLVGQHNYHPPFPAMSHTFARMPFRLGGRDIAVVVDEQGREAKSGALPAFTWIYDVTDETAIHPIAAYSVSPEEAWGTAAQAPGTRFGAHQCHERMTGSLVYIAWFRGGLRIIDIADPTAPQTVGFFVPPPSAGQAAPESNDVFVDARGNIYLLDRVRGLDILEYTGPRGLTAPI